jgi:hypothetical protein
MSNRRVDAIYFVLLLAVFAIGYYAANRSSDPSEVGATLDLRDFNPPPLVLEVPYDFPVAVVKFESLVAPTLDLSDDMESVLSEIRSALLKTSTLVEVRSMERLVAAAE